MASVSKGSTFKSLYDALNYLARVHNEYTFIEEFVKTFISNKRRITAASTRNERELFSARTIHMKRVETDELHGIFDRETTRIKRASKSNRQHKFIVVTDMTTLLGYNIETEAKIEVEIKYLASATEFFLPLTNNLVSSPVPEEFQFEFDVVQEMASIYDIIRVDNQFSTDAELSEFMIRLVFCLFAEDVGLFKNDLFLNQLKGTKEDGSDLSSTIRAFFITLDLPESARSDNRYSHLPYVNGGLFSGSPYSPVMSSELRRHIIKLAELDWGKLNPQLFGSMFPSIMNLNERHLIGGRIQASTGINKLIDLTFLDELRAEYDRLKNLDIDDNAVLTKSYVKLLKRISQVRVVDVNCGSGILPIAYSSLRELEYDIVVELKAMNGQAFVDGYSSLVKPDSFGGMQEDTVVYQIAKLSMWLTDFQINIKFEKDLSVSYTKFPLSSLPKIINDDAQAIASWDQFHEAGVNTYIISNLMNVEHIDDVHEWIDRAAEEIRDTDVQFTFSAADRVCQGHAASTIWSGILDDGIDIRFACQSFKWDSTRDAVVVGIAHNNEQQRVIISSDGQSHNVKAINGYLFESKAVAVEPSSKPLFQLPSVVEGCKRDSVTNVVMTRDEKDKYLSSNPSAAPFIKRYIDTKFVHGEANYCIFMNEKSDISTSFGRNLILDHEMDVKMVSHFICHDGYQDAPSMIIPKMVDHMYSYIPVTVVGSETVSHMANYVVYNPERWMFALLSSKMHLEWSRNVGVVLDTRISYVAGSCYNAFPVPELTDGHKRALAGYANQIIRCRAQSVDSLHDMYCDMSDELKAAHDELDKYIDNLYLSVIERKRRLTADVDRVSILFKMYQMHKDGVALTLESITNELSDLAKMFSEGQ